MIRTLRVGIGLQFFFRNLLMHIYDVYLCRIRTIGRCSRVMDKLDDIIGNFVGLLAPNFVLTSDVNILRKNKLYRNTQMTAR